MRGVSHSMSWEGELIILSVNLGKWALANLFRGELSCEDAPDCPDRMFRPNQGGRAGSDFDESSARQQRFTKHQSWYRSYPYSHRAI